MSGDLSSAMLIPLLISGCGISLTAIVILIYHFLIVQYCLGRQDRLSEDTILGFNNTDTVQASHANKLGIDKSALALIPTVGYSTQIFNDLLRGDQCECAICLADLEEGVSIRLLPNCRHVFHVKCVDQWLSSHVNCPTCRSQIFPFVFSEWIVEFEDDDVAARGNGPQPRRCVPVFRSKNPPGSGLGFVRRNINPMELQPINTNTSNNISVITNTPSSSYSNVICETSVREINVAENENGNNNNNNNNNNKACYDPSSSSASFSSCSSSNGSTDLTSEDTISSQFDRVSLKFMRSLSQLRMAGWGSSTVGGADSDSPC